MAKDTAPKEDAPKEETQFYKPIDESQPLGTVENRFPSNIPLAKVRPGASRPNYSEFSGEYTRASDGEVYALAVVENDPLGRTHKAINSLHYWEGTEDQFKKEFPQPDETDEKAEDKT